MNLFPVAKAQYEELGVDVESAIEVSLATPISIHCWQGDDVTGFEQHEATDGGGILATGSYPGKARNADELRQDLEEVMRLVPGVSRVNLHAIYAEAPKGTERNALEPTHFANWMDWAHDHGINFDFNPTYFAHPKAADGLTLSHPDRHIRQYWIEHGQACRAIAAAMAHRQDDDCVLNHWIPDGRKDSPADRWSPRQRLTESLDAILQFPLPCFAGEGRGGGETCLDSVESKLFGLGSEDYVVGSFEFYSHYSLLRKVLLCLDMGHFHPTETIADKLSALLQFHESLLLHVSRPIRWDSDHVVLFNDDLRAVFQELARGNALHRIRAALDFFDASINRISAYCIGIRATRKALLYALLEPIEKYKELESNGRGDAKLAWMEEAKTLPFGAIWDELCNRASVPSAGWIEESRAYEDRVLKARN